MLPLYIDINPNCEAATTLNRDQTEYRIHAIPSEFNGNLINLRDIPDQELISVFTNLSITKEQPLQYIEGSSYLSDDFDVVAIFQFKATKTIKAKIKYSKFTPSIILD